MATIAILAPSAAFGSGETLAAAKALYGAASFDGALATIDQLDAAEAAHPDALVYKALCLLALGRPTDARVVTDALVTNEPAFSPAGGDFSPRFLDLLTETKRRIVPAIATRLFAEAREHVRTHQDVDARRTFQQVLALASDAAWRDSSEAADLRTLASAFLDLMSAAPTASAPAAAAPTAAAVIEPPPTAHPASVLAVVKGPVVLSQQMPKWMPATAVSATKIFHGQVKVRIGTDGRVVDASITMPTEPAYDRSVLAAARKWMYSPATRDGQPVEVERTVEFQLRGR